ncbi:MAG TPA: hypothetical protein VNK43_10870 [Gemmatimonadales bacterium]|nr:hypothetical protein [Gemmatimonadales bacterium]
MPSPCPAKVLIGALAILVAAPGAPARPTPAAAQASAYLPLDDPDLAAIEHLIARGAVADPSPMVRPFTRADAVRVLERADTTAPRDAAIVRRLLARLRDPDAELWWRADGEAGGQGFSHARRDPLHPAGPDGVRPYAELGLQAKADKLLLATRAALEPRIVKDPDWPGRRDLTVATRQLDAYLSAQFRWARIYYGQMDRNWGATGFPGISLSDYGYGRPALELELVTRDVQLRAIAAQLGDERDSTGAVVHRYHFAHRLGLRLSDRLHLGLWEATILAGASRNFEDRYRNPLSVAYLAQTIGLGDRGNVMLGLDLDWRVRRRTTLQLQLALDDLTYQDRGAPDRNPDRWALAAVATGPLGGGAAWRVGYTRATSLAFRAFNPFESFVDLGVGIGRGFADNDQATAVVTFPVAASWLVSPELTLLRQGEGRLTAPYPAGEERGRTPQIFIGTVERTYRAAVGLAGRQGPLAVRADAGFHHVVNHGHVAGRTDNQFVGRIELTLGLSRQGALQ